MKALKKQMIAEKEEQGQYPSREEAQGGGIPNKSKKKLRKIVETEEEHFEEENKDEQGFTGAFVSNSGIIGDHLKTKFGGVTVKSRNLGL